MLIHRDFVLCVFYSFSFIVTGDFLGHVKFYDENFKLLSWYSEFKLDPIKSISFSREPSPICSQGYQEDCTMEAKPFVVR